MRLLIISDVHGNKEALDAVMAVPHDEVICLGDLVDYGPSPGECIDVLTEQKITTIMGNHDSAVAFRMDCGCGYAYKHLSQSTREYTWNVLNDEQIEFLRKLPQSFERTQKGKKLYFTHGSPLSFHDYIKPDTPEATIQEYIKEVEADFIFIGHSHLPFIRKIGDVTLVNPGSVGQPRDGDTRASCAIFNTDTLEAEIVRVEYDMEDVFGKIRANMPNTDELILILKRGY
ncbi:phosphoesterase, MJ0936 family [Methanomethylovorans hollandica DSM 15978]|uniref:Phosphoesterase n=1 Tax=Methanomethylovorans hollandica (strain DSM 15978 / NBRC 107637 / DMS1) TaxID=867904 RepID=L0KUN1_METHD|nr:metallophosphoesterase family protein [Methanomethylovorans hollandica]AGB49157.1 phosphoesterase, MJ0936 family [Methanomethylovorans hollandica DSM 15978]